MMPRKASQQPTEVELHILEVLWEHAPCPLGIIQNNISNSETKSYTTIQTMVRVMVEKGLVIRDDSVHPMLYRPAKSRDVTRQQILADITDRAFQGSAQKVVMSLLDSKKIDSDELSEIKKMIEQAESERGHNG
ncbi:MAG: BlaI/MecI/CopY family transcriptional regulator [Verrucomicrobiota bacterium]